MGVAVAIGAGVGVGGIGVGVAVDSGVGVGAGVAVGMRVGVGSGDGGSVGILVAASCCCRVVGVGLAGAGDVAVGMRVGVGVGIGVAVALGVGSGDGGSVGVLVAPGCCCCVVGVGLAGACDVAVAAAVSAWGVSLRQADSVIARVIIAAIVRPILSITYCYSVPVPVVKTAPPLTIPRRDRGLGAPRANCTTERGACWVGEAVVVSQGPVVGLDQDAAVVSPAETVVALGNRTANHVAGRLSPRKPASRRAGPGALQSGILSSASPWKTVRAGMPWRNSGLR